MNHITFPLKPHFRFEEVFPCSGMLIAFGAFRNEMTFFAPMNGSNNGELPLYEVKLKPDHTPAFQF